MLTIPKIKAGLNACADALCSPLAYKIRMGLVAVGGLLWGCALADPKADPRAAAGVLGVIFLATLGVEGIVKIITGKTVGQREAEVGRKKYRKKMYHRWCSRFSHSKWYNKTI